VIRCGPRARHRRTTNRHPPPFATGVATIPHGLCQPPRHLQYGDTWIMQ
jgi:hypothetical protein